MEETRARAAPPCTRLCTRSPCQKTKQSRTPRLHIRAIMVRPSLVVYFRSCQLHSVAKHYVGEIRSRNSDRENDQPMEQCSD